MGGRIDVDVYKQSPLVIRDIHQRHGHRDVDKIKHIRLAEARMSSEYAEGCGKHEVYIYRSGTKGKPEYSVSFDEVRNVVQGDRERGIRHGTRRRWRYSELLLTCTSSSTRWTGSHVRHPEPCIRERVRR